MKVELSTGMGAGKEAEIETGMDAGIRAWIEVRMEHEVVVGIK